MTVLRRRLRAEGHCSGVVAALVAELAERFGLEPEAAYRLRLAADELTTNALTHGYGPPGGVLDLAGGADAAGVWVRIEDEAPPFDPRSHRPVPRRTPGGYGLTLAAAAVDVLAYEHAAGRNRTTLILRRPPADTDGPGKDGNDGDPHPGGR